MLKLITKGQVLINDIRNNKEGASLIEYSILIGLLTAAVIALILAVGGSITEIWTTLSTTIAPTG